jgi:hypothetical protein
VNLAGKLEIVGIFLEPLYVSLGSAVARFGTESWIHAKWMFLINIIHRLSNC